MRNQSEGERPFDLELLTRPWQERLEYFAKYKVAHSRLVTVSKKVVSSVLHPNDKNFVFLVGPPRAGKTTAQTYIINTLLEGFHDEMLRNPGSIPVIWIESSAYPSSYNWKDHWATALQALKEPLIDSKIMPPPGSRYVTGGLRVGDEIKGAATAFRNSFRTAALERHLRVLINDEAHHMTKARSRTRIIDHAEILKSDASKSGAVFVLGGTYDLLDLANLNGQLGCRTEIVHFSRYQPDSDEDLRAFGSAVLSLAECMPLHEPPNLSSHLDYIYEMSLGCVGLLKMWLYETLKAVSEKQKTKLTMSDLEENKLPAEVRLEVAREIYRGEAKLREDNSKEDQIRHYLGVKTGGGQKAGSKANMATGQVKLDEGAIGGRNGHKGRSKPGERNPKRDPVGEGRERAA